MKNISNLVIILLLTLSGCKELGTDTGNPFSSGDDQAQTCGKNGKSGRCMPTPYVRMQAGNICEVVNRCYSVSKQTCYDAVFNQTGLNLVQQSLPFENYKELTEAYDQKMINVNSSALGICMNAFDQLDCNSETVHEIYSLDQPQDYSNIHKILYAHSTCLEIYSLR